MIEKDCFAYTEKKRNQECKALKELYCEKEKCKFYKRKDEIDIDKIEEAIKEYSRK